MQLKNIYTFILLLLLSAGNAFAQLPCDNSCSANATLEQEVCGLGTNDDCNNAELIKCGDIICGTTYNGGVFSTFDTDWYKFILLQEQQVNLTINSSKSFFISIIDNCTDQNIIDVTTNQPCVEGIITVTLQPGTYYINVFPNITSPETWNCINSVSYSFKLSCAIENPTCNLEVLTDVTNPSCTGLGDDGAISLLIVNGQPLYDVQWNNGATDQDLFGLTPGTYCYTVTDGLGCTATDCVTLTAASCSAPNGLSANVLSSTKAIISWNISPCALKYRVQIRPLGTTQWTTYFVNGNQTAKQINNLASGTTYQYRVRAVCSADGSVISPFSAIQTFNTGGCPPPLNPEVNILSATEAEVFWTTVSGATKYRIRYRPVGSGTWQLTTVNHPQSSAILSNLSPATTYEFQILSLCGSPSVLSSPTALQQFTTNAFRSDLSATAQGVSLFPNPTTGAVTIALSGYKGLATIEVFDILGKQISYEQVALNYGGASILNRDYSQLTPGMYIVRISANGTGHNIKLVKD